MVSMQTRQANLEGTGEIRLRRLVKEALRMRPSRIIVGEVHQEESLDLLIALNSGATRYANRTPGTDVTRARCHATGGVPSRCPSPRACPFDHRR